MKQIHTTDQHQYKAQQIISFYTSKKEEFWLQEREKNALRLFHAAARRVPAYQDFFKKHHVNPTKIKTFKDFWLIPPTSKREYLRKYPYEKLTWDGTLRKSFAVSATSGSTGKPFYFPRSADLEWESSIAHEMFLQNTPHAAQRSTLAITCFGMGVWIGGLITHRAFQIAGERGYPVSLLSPGINKIEIFNALRELAPNFEQTVLAGYPPFIKDVLDEAPEQGIDLAKLNIRLLFAAEPFSEKFREYVFEKIKGKNIHTDTLNIYGTADIGTMAYETPTAILIRRLAVQNPAVFEDLFPEIHKTPTLAQYNPLFITFESAEGKILLTGENTFPLIRYDLGDHGGVFTYKEITSCLEQHGISLQEEAKKAGIEDKIYQLPFVYVYERTDLSTTLYGLQIYPETIREALLEKPIDRFLTGKFTMFTKFDRKQNQYIEINLEVQKGKDATTQLKKLTRERIVSSLLGKNSEFRELHHHLGKRTVPRLVFWKAESPTYFKPGIKQRWVLHKNKNM